MLNVKFLSEGAKLKGLSPNSKFFKGEAPKNYLQAITPNELTSGRAAKRL